MSKRVDKYGYEIPDECFEWCPHCECEVEIATDKIGLCPAPGCGYHIRACAVCDSHDDCDWRNDGYCLKFPDYRYQKYDSFGEVKKEPRMDTPLAMLRVVVDGMKAQARRLDWDYECPVCGGDGRRLDKCKPSCKLDKMLNGGKSVRE